MWRWLEASTKWAKREWKEEKGDAEIKTIKLQWMRVDFRLEIAGELHSNFWFMKALMDFSDGVEASCQIGLKMMIDFSREFSTWVACEFFNCKTEII